MIRQEADLHREIENFRHIASSLVPRPGDTPRLDGIDIYGESLPLNDAVGGDHIIYVDFNARFDLTRRLAEATDPAVRANLEKNRSRAGILLADVAGHQATDATVHFGLHHAFLTGVLYELDINGEVTTRLFENLNSRFFQTAHFSKYITMIYGEIAESGDFNFLSAGHPAPCVYSREFDRIVDIGPDRLTSFFPIGMFPSEDSVDRRMISPDVVGKKRYTVNNIKLLSPGDVLILSTDGLQDHEADGRFYFPDQLQAALRQCRDGSAREIFDHLAADLRGFAAARDDISLVVVKKVS